MAENERNNIYNEDDRQYLEDSREEGIGCVFLDDIVGVVHIRLLPSFTMYR